MLIRDINSSRCHGGHAQAAVRGKFDSVRPLGVRKSTCKPTDASCIAEYLHEDLAQSLVAIKLNLERLAQNELNGAKLDPSIAALRDAIRQVSSLAVGIRPVAARRTRLRIAVG